MSAPFIREVVWAPEALKAAQAAPAEHRRRLRDVLAALAIGPVPPAPESNALPDLELPDTHHLRTEAMRLVAGVYPDRVRVWLIRPRRPSARHAAAASAV
ncbi:hypothetical protein J0910_27895 [Nocardiopsis sp. CNT-189]|uniref:hypothetical protein n=1 Tax=Nocardiopsis oceanisediminis TaxID=2816862 RepID=UPI003B2A3DE4